MYVLLVLDSYSSISLYMILIAITSFVDSLWDVQTPVNRPRLQEVAARLVTVTLQDSPRCCQRQAPVPSFRIGDERWSV